MGKKVLRSSDTLAEVSKKVNSDFKDCSVVDKLGALAISKKMTDHCNTLYKKTKSHIERELEPTDIENILEKSTVNPKSFGGAIVAVNTLFGTEYLLGERKWIVKAFKAKSATDVLVSAAASNPEIKASLLRHGIISYEPSIDYNAIHAVVDTLSSKDDIPAELEILRSVVEVVDTERTVLISTIKSNVSEEDIEKYEDAVSK